MAITQKRMDQLIVGAKRRHKERVERLRQAFLGKRAEVEFAPNDNVQDLSIPEREIING